MAATRPRKKLTRTEKIKQKLLVRMIRSHFYTSFPKPVNKTVQCICGKKLGAPWDELYDSLMHIDELYNNMRVQRCRESGHIVTDQRECCDICIGDDKHILYKNDEIKVTDPNFRFRRQLPYNIIVLLFDINKSKCIKREQRKIAKLVLYSHIKEVHVKRRDTFIKLIFYWMRNANIECGNILDMNVCYLILKYRCREKLHRKSLILTSKRYLMGKFVE